MADTALAPQPAGRRLVALVLLSTVLGTIGGGAGAWALYRRLGPAERVVAPAVVIPGGDQRTGDAPTYASLAAAAAPALVAIVVTPVTAADIAAGSARFGTGFAVGGGLVMTSARAVQGATRLQLAWADGELVDASVAGSDLAHGLAVLRPAQQPTTRPTPLAFADFSQRAPRAGDLVLAVGSRPLAGVSVTAGTVSAVGCGAGVSAGATAAGPGTLDALTVNATGSPADEGAPLLDGSGRVVGVVSSGAEGAALVGLDGRTASTLAAALARGDTTARPTFGAATCGLDAAHAAAVHARAGALVLTLVSGGPAEIAGLRPGDVVTAVDGRPIDAEHPLDATALGIASGQPVRLTVVRDGADRQVSVTVV